MDFLIDNKNEENEKENREINLENEVFYEEQLERNKENWYITRKETYLLEYGEEEITIMNEDEIYAKEWLKY